MPLVSIQTCISTAFREVSKPITVQSNSTPRDPDQVR